MTSSMFPMVFNTTDVSFKKMFLYVHENNEYKVWKPRMVQGSG